MGWGDSREGAGSGRRGGGSVSEGPRRGKADLHVHTASGDGMASPRQILDYVEAETDLDVIAGMEVTAIEGHVIALWVEEPLPSLRPVEEVLEAVHRQGGLAVAAHPLSWLTRSLSQKTLDRLVAS